MLFYVFFLGIGFGCHNVAMYPMCLFGYHLFCVSQDLNEYDTVYIYIERGRERERERERVSHQHINVVNRH